MRRFGCVLSQAVLRQLGHIGGEGFAVDEDELRCHRHLQDLYNSTRAAKVGDSSTHRLDRLLVVYWRGMTSVSVCASSAPPEEYGTRS